MSKNFNQLVERNMKMEPIIDDLTKHNDVRKINETFNIVDNYIDFFFKSEEIKYIKTEKEYVYYLPWLNTTVEDHYKIYTLLWDYYKRFKKLFKAEQCAVGLNLSALTIELVLKRYLNDLEKRETQAYFENIRFTKSPGEATMGRHELSKLVKIMVDEKDLSIKTELVEAVLQHFIWGIKQKILNQNRDIKDRVNVYPIVPILYSPEQGTGKSKFIDNFFEPIKQVTGNVDKDSIFERYTYDMIETHFLLAIHELATFSNNEVQSLKNLVTSTSKTGRQKGSSKAQTFQNNASFIFASNTSYEEIIQDETGNRRFFQIRVKSFHKEFDDIDILRIWRAVDENSPTYLNENMLKKLADAQYRQRKKTNIENFISDNKVSSKMFSHQEVEFIPSKKLHQYYVLSLKNHAIKIEPVSVFSRKVAQILKQDPSSRRYYVDKKAIEENGYYILTSHKLGLDINKGVLDKDEIYVTDEERKLAIEYMQEQFMELDDEELQ